MVQHSCKKVVWFATHEYSRIKMSAALFLTFGIIVLLFVLCPLDQLKTETLQTEAATEVSRNRSTNATKASENTCDIFFFLHNIYCPLHIFYQCFTTMKYNNKIQIAFLLRNYRLKGGFYVKDKKVYIISRLLCHRFAIKK